MMLMQLIAAYHGQFKCVLRQYQICAACKYAGAIL